MTFEDSMSAPLAIEEVDTIEKRGHEARHHRIEVALRSHDPDIRKLGRRFTREIVEYPPAKRLCRIARLQDFHQRDPRPIDHAIPGVLFDEIGNAEPGFLRNLADDAAGKINFAVDDITGIGRTGGEIDLAGSRSLRPHD